MAQFAAHDLVFNPTRVPNLFDGLRASQDQRQQRLMLETLYGGGPGVCPHLYRRDPGENNIERSAMRLTMVADDVGMESLCSRLPSSLGAYRDVVRISLNDGTIKNERFRILGDALLADPRNDDHLVISQLTTLFALLHNIFVENIISRTGSRSTGREVFWKASKATTLIYRSILFNDLLPRLIDPRVLSAYEAGYLLEANAPAQMSREFAHAVFRAGHSMVRPEYKLNWEKIGKKDTATIFQILDRRSITSPLGGMHHRDNWLVQWSNFFQVSRNTKPRMAAKISPEIVAPFAKHNTFKSDSDGVGLAYIDLARGAFSDVRSVRSLVSLMQRENAPLVDDMEPDKFLTGMKGWLQGKVAEGRPHGLKAKDVCPILKDPPLLFYIMYEASQSSGNHLFGPLGSVVVAETFFACRKRTETLIEDDPRSTETINRLFRSIDEEVPDVRAMNMPWLIRFLARHYQYEDKGKRFI